MPTYYLEQEDLEHALGAAIVLAIFDDNLDGDVETGAVDACRLYGTTECNSFFRTTHAIELPFDPVPDEVKIAAVDFACAYATRRRPDVVRAMGEAPWTTFHEQAVARMKRYAETLQRLPRDVAVPDNVGATVGLADGTTSRSASTSCTPARQWDDMGDF